MQLARISARLSWTCWTGMRFTTEKVGMQLHHNSQKTETQLPGNWTSLSSQIFIAQWLCSFVYFCISVWIVCIVEMTQEVDESTWFAFVQLIEWGSGLYDKTHRDFAQRDGMDLAWEWILHKMKVSSKYMFSNKMYNRIQILNRLVSATMTPVA